MTSQYGFQPNQNSSSTKMETIENSQQSGRFANTRVGRLFLLDLSEGRILSVNPDGPDQKTVVGEGRHPDGIVVDVEAGNI